MVLSIILHHLPDPMWIIYYGIAKILDFGVDLGQGRIIGRTAR